MNSFLAGIGHICLQWALLEHTILMIIGMVENLPAEKAYDRYARLDMIPRLNMAIALAEDAKWPLRYTRRLRAIRKEVQNGLADRRNLFVHGAHDMGKQDGEFILTMSRWKGDKRQQTVTLLDATELASRLSLLAQEGHSIFTDYGVWKFGPTIMKTTVRTSRRPRPRSGLYAHKISNEASN